MKVKIKDLDIERGTEKSRVTALKHTAQNSRQSEQPIS